MGQLKRQLLIWGAIATTTAVLPGLALADNASPDRWGGRHGRGERHSDAKLSVAGRAISRGTTDSYGMQIRGRSGDKPTDAGGMIRFAHRADQTMEGLVGEITCLSKDSAGIVTATGTIKRSGKRAKGDKMKPGAAETAAQNDDGTAFLDEIVPWDADEAPDLAASTELEADDPTVPGAPAAPSVPSAPGQDPNKDPNRKGPDRGRRSAGELAGKDFAFTIDVPGKPQHFSQPTIGDKGTLAACSGGGAPVEVTRGGFRTREANGDQTDRGDRGDRRGRRGWWRR
jgi:hypothetical protein